MKTAKRFVYVVLIYISIINCKKCLKIGGKTGVNRVRKCTKNFAWWWRFVALARDVCDVA